MKLFIVRMALLASMALPISFTASAQVRVYVKVHPPPPVVVRPAPPGPAHIWIGEEWEPRGDHYVFVGGHWAAPPHPGYVWVPGHWRFYEHHGEAWIPGHWRRVH